MDSYAILSRLVSCMRLRRHQKSKGNTKGAQGNCYNCTWIHKQGKSAAKCHRTFETTQITSCCVFYYQQGMMGLDFPGTPCKPCLVETPQSRLIRWSEMNEMYCILIKGKFSYPTPWHNMTHKIFYKLNLRPSSPCAQEGTEPPRLTM